MQKKANKPKKLSKKQKKAQKALDLRAVEQKKIDAAKADVEAMELINQRLTALEVRARAAGVKGDKGDRGEKGSGFWG